MPSGVKREYILVQKHPDDPGTRNASTRNNTIKPHTFGAQGLSQRHNQQVKIPQAGQVPKNDSALVSNQDLTEVADPPRYSIDDKDHQVMTDTGTLKS